MTLRISILTLLMINIIAFCVAQQAEYIPYHNSDTLKIHSLALNHKQSLKNAFELPKGVSQDYKKNYLSMTKEFSENIFSTIKNTALIDSVIDPYVQGVFNNILEANVMLPNTQLIVVRNPIPNASAYGDGTIILNVGIISKLENESQLAFVVCHELAHIYYNHMQNGLKEHFDTFYNKEFKKEFKKIIKEEYNLNSKLNALVQNASLNKLYHKRESEQQADSLGFILLRSAGYKVDEAYNTLKILDKIEDPYSKEDIDFQLHFGCQNSPNPLKEKSKRSSSIFEVEKEIPKEFELSDTLKTHPDCKKRMMFIQELMAEMPTPNTFESLNKNRANNKSFDYIKSVSRFEVIQSWYDAKRFDYALYESLLLLQKEPDNSYLHQLVLLCLHELKNHLKLHKYSDVVSKVSDYNPDNLNQLIERLHDLNLFDFKVLGKCFKELHTSSSNVENEFKVAAIYAYHKLLDEKEAADAVKEQYIKVYPQGRLKNSILD